ncbi:hypothetical protein [Nocardioides nitrophenolicus]|nr:hypothetical protein [Nocardioides nitrophenolicus]MBM7518251.1 hypothetical protein [Nocardioides nitrophenolicus]
MTGQEQVTPEVLAALADLRAEWEATCERLERRIDELEQRQANREARA